jgi:hypothetical protein
VRQSGVHHKIESDTDADASTAVVSPRMRSGTRVGKLTAVAAVPADDMHTTAANASQAHIDSFGTILLDMLGRPITLGRLHLPSGRSEPDATRSL